MVTYSAVARMSRSASTGPPGSTLGLNANQHVLEAFAAAGMDADTFGYDVNMYVPDRTDHLRDLVARSRFAWVSANLRDGGHPVQAFAANQGARLWVLKQSQVASCGVAGDRRHGMSAQDAASCATSWLDVADRFGWSVPMSKASEVSDR